MDTENQAMEPFQTEENKVEQEENTLKITGEITSQLNDAGKWGKFLAIMGFIMMGFMVLAGFVMSIVMAFIPLPSNSPFPFPPFLFGIFYLILAMVYLFPVLYLYRFSTGIKQAILLKNQDQLTRAFFNLKAFYRFIGILTIVFLALYPLLIVGIIVIGVFSGFSHSGGLPA